VSAGGASRPSWRRKLGCSLASLAGFLVLVEGGGRLALRWGPSRVVDAEGRRALLVEEDAGVVRPVAGFRGRQVAGEFDVRVVTDARGCRVDPDARAPEDGPVGLELIVVGDSFAFGSGVECAETFGARLGERLRAELPGVAVRVTNLGCPGTGTRSQRLRLERWLDERSGAAPFVVVWNLLLEDSPASGNDLIDNWNAVRAVASDREAGDDAAGGPRTHLTREARRELEPGTLVRVKEALVRHSVSYDLLMRAAGRALRARAPGGRTDANAARLDEAWEALGAELAAGAEAVRRRGGEVVFGWFPFFRAVASDDDDAWERLGRVLPPGARAVSLLDALRGHAGEYSFPRDGHPTPRGHELAAEGYAEEVLAASRRALERSSEAAR